MPSEEVIAYFSKFDGKTFQVVACGKDAPTPADLDQLEATIGFRLPDEFRHFFLSPLGGLYMQAREEIWPLAQPRAVGPFWSFLRGLMVYGVARDIPAWLDIRVQYAEFRDYEQRERGAVRGVVPFLKVEGDPNHYCFDRAGDIYQWDHETDELEPVDLTFSNLLMREVRALELRVRRKRRGEDR